MQLWNHAIAKILERMEDTRKRVGNNYPHWCDYETGKWTTTVDGDWTGGFWPGMHWLAAKYTGDHCPGTAPHLAHHRSRTGLCIAARLRAPAIAKSVASFRLPPPRNWSALSNCPQRCLNRLPPRQRRCRSECRIKRSAPASAALPRAA